MPATVVTTGAWDETQDVCSRVFFPHRLAVLDASEVFEMSLSAVSFGAVSAGVLSYSGEVCLETGELQTAYEINVPLDGSLRTWIGSTEVCATRSLAAVYRPDASTRLHGWAGGGRLFGLKIDRAALDSTIEELIDRPVRSVAPLAPSLDLSGGAGAQWWQLAQVLMSIIDDPDGPLAAPLVSRPLVQSVLTAFLFAVDHPWRELLASPPALPRASTTREAVELLEAHPEAPWTVADLARRVGVSSRGLQAGFARRVGRSPMAYLRGARLQRVHEDLRAAAPGQVSVTDVALRWGFTHHGRFAAAYRERYGCAPSHTLAKGV
ncbi:MAG: AraC family transcriptional regulator [Pseudonocardia sp.]|nr:AraC family transcriptional regulator [Pseudonocardia sp.]